MLVHFIGFVKYMRISNLSDDLKLLNEISILFPSTYHCFNLFMCYFQVPVIRQHDLKLAYWTCVLKSVQPTSIQQFILISVYACKQWKNKCLLWSLVFSIRATCTKSYSPKKDIIWINIKNIYDIKFGIRKTEVQKRSAYSFNLSCYEQFKTNITYS